MTVMPTPRDRRIPALRVVGEATDEQLASWDGRVVDVPGGDVYQSLAWGAQRERAGAQVHHLLLDDGSGALVLGRRRRALGGDRAYVPRGPVAAGADERMVAGRLAAIAAWARDAGFDVIVADPEIPGRSGFPALLADMGFRQVEEIAPSRHRVGIAIPAGATDADLLERIATTTRQRFLAAERRGMRVIRIDRGGAGARAGEEVPPPAGLDAAASAAFERLHTLLADTGSRRGFVIGGRAEVIAWWQAALDAGHLCLLEARAADDTSVAAAVFYRHGERLTYGHSGDVVVLRHAHPGAVHLLVWRALQIAAREGRSELDLGGVDVRGARGRPGPGDPMYGLLQFKESFGGEWVELSGAQELVLRPVRHGAATVASSAARTARALLRRDQPGGRA
jgi:peptidoglycan pentaglycine glycine transferase (the first glycine)